MPYDRVQVFAVFGEGDRVAVDVGLAHLPDEDAPPLGKSLEQRPPDRGLLSRPSDPHRGPWPGLLPATVQQVVGHVREHATARLHPAVVVEVAEATRAEVEQQEAEVARPVGQAEALLMKVIQHAAAAEIVREAEMDRTHLS